MYRNLTAEKFWARVDRSGDCWLWLGARSAKGYGISRWNGERTAAHRVAYLLTHGRIPWDHLGRSLWVLHHCDNPPCVRPDHLYPGGAQENARDAIKRHRARPGGRDRWMPWPCPLRIFLLEYCRSRMIRDGTLTMLHKISLDAVMSP